MSCTSEHKISVAEFHAKCMEKRKALMNEIPDIEKVNKQRALNISHLKADPLTYLADMNASFCHSISAKDNLITIKDKQKFEESYQMLRSFLLFVNTLV